MPNRKSYLTFSMLIIAFLITIAVTPRTNLEAISIPKFFILVVGSSVVTFAFVFNSKHTHQSKERNCIMVSIAVLVIIVGVSIFNKSFSTRESFVGIYGRRFGILSIISILLLSFVAYKIVQEQEAILFSTTFNLASLVVGSYFLAQTYDYDFAKWSEPYGVANSTLGNPNFLSAIAGTSLLSSISTLSIVSGTIHKAISVLNIPVSIFMLFETISFQGFAIVGLGLLFLFAVSVRRIFPRYAVFRIFRASGVFVGLSLLVLAPKLLEFVGNQSTLQRRFDYWRASFRMMADKPFVGFGWDSFGDWYLRYRDQNAVAAGSAIFTDSPHSLLIEIGLSAGIFVLSLYFLFLVLVFKTLFALLFLLMRDISDSTLVVPLGTVWIGMTLQSLVNPVSLPLTVWHFLSGAFLLGIMRDRNRAPSAKQSRSRLSSRINQRIGQKPSRREKSQHKEIIRMFIIALSGTYLIFCVNSAVAVYQGDANVYKAIAQGDGEALLVAVLEKNSDPQLMKTAVGLFNENSMKQFSLRIINELTKRNPNDFFAWKLLYETSTTEEHRTQALTKMKELDPLNPDLATLVP